MVPGPASLVSLLVVSSSSSSSSIKVKKVLGGEVAVVTVTVTVEEKEEEWPQIRTVNAAVALANGPRTPAKAAAQTVQNSCVQESYHQKAVVAAMELKQVGSH